MWQFMIFFICVGSAAYLSYHRMFLNYGDGEASSEKLEFSMLSFSIYSLGSETV